jgi:hypothetical protein
MLGRVATGPIDGAPLPSGSTLFSAGPVARRRGWSRERGLWELLCEYKGLARCKTHLPSYADVHLQMPQYGLRATITNRYPTPGSYAQIPFTE